MEIVAHSFVAVIVLMFFLSVSDANILCSKGQYLDRKTGDSLKCVPCPEGTYSDNDNHHDIDCAPCTYADPILHEVVRRKCTASSDTVIICDAGYFRQEQQFSVFKDGQCTRCSSCEVDPVNKYETQSCTLYSDTVCCPRPDMEVKRGNGDRFECV